MTTNELLNQIEFTRCECGCSNPSTHKVCDDCGAFLPRDTRAEDAQEVAPKTPAENSDPRPLARMSFDGFGVNDSDEYRTRLAKLTARGRDRGIGPLLSAAPDLLAILERGIECGFFADAPVYRADVQAAIDRAKGKTK